MTLSRNEFHKQKPVIAKKEIEYEVDITYLLFI